MLGFDGKIENRPRFCIFGASFLKRFSIFGASSLKCVPIVVKAWLLHM